MGKATATKEEEKDEFSGGEEVASNWFKFLNVGDLIKGTLMNKHFQKTNDPMFPDQWVYEIKVTASTPSVPVGSIQSVGISVKKSGTIQRLNNCQLGQIIGIKFDKEGEQTAEQIKKKLAPAKYLVVKTWGMDPQYDPMDTGEGAVAADEEPEM